MVLCMCVLCMYVYVHMGVETCSECISECAYACRTLKLISGVFLNLFPLYQDRVI